LRNYNTILMFLLSIMLIFSINNAVEASEENFFDGILWETKFTDNPFKEWTIKFNLPVDFSSVNDKNVYITNQKEKLIPTKVKAATDKKSITVSPQQHFEGYEQGMTNYLYISKNIRSEKERNLKNNIKVPFVYNKKNSEYIYYFNMTPDYEFYNSDQDSYRIFKMKDGKREKISNNAAYALTVMDDTVYYMKIDDLEREEGYVQRGDLWQVKIDGSDEKQVIDERIFTITSDDKYLYFTGDMFGNNIMRMQPNMEPEIFQENCKSYRLFHSDGWLYYVDAKNGGIKRINTLTKAKESVTNHSANYYSGFAFTVYNNHLILNVMDYSNWNSYNIRINIKTGEEKIEDDRKIYLDVSDTGILHIYNFNKQEMEFVQFIE
jgi:hypothetical protein